jgi:hypothetical protein
VKCLDFLPTIHTIMLNSWQFFLKISFTHLIVDFVTIIGILSLIKIEIFLKFSDHTNILILLMLSYSYKYMYM